MKIVNSKEEYNEHNKYRITTYELDQGVKTMYELAGVLKAFENENTKMSTCLCTKYIDESTENYLYNSIDEMLADANKYHEYTYFDGNYINTDTNEYQYDIVVYENSNIIEKVVNPNKIEKKNTSSRKI